MNSFSVDLSQFNIKTLKQADIVRRKVILEVLRGVVKRTPVDTGRARGNWQVSTGNPIDEEIDKKDKNGGVTIRAGVSEIKQSLIDQTLFIANNVPYINALEDGWSGQAPNGMLKVTLASFPYIVENSKRGTNFA